MEALQLGRAADVLRAFGRTAVWPGLGLLAALAGSLPAGAQQPKVLKFAHLFPASHYFWEQGGGVFAKEVEKASDGRLKFQVYPAGQLGKDYYALLRSGIADIAILVPSYATDKFPMTSVGELPGLYKTACEGVTKFWNVARPGGPLDENEYKPLGLHVLFVTVLSPYSIMTSSKAVATLQDLKGLKLRANGAAMDKTIRALGAVPVRVSSPETYDALTRGTIDGAFFPYQGLPTFRLEMVLKHSVNGTQLGSGTIIYAMATKSWDGLSDDLKEILTQAAKTTQASLCKWQDDEDAKVREKVVAQDGHAIVDLSPEEIALWEEKLNGVAAAWAQEMDAAGKKGSELLRAFRSAPER
jgi:TRAP-type C4-dicarboxylate transport system substrate-binding protein